MTTNHVSSPAAAGNWRGGGAGVRPRGYNVAFTYQRPPGRRRGGAPSAKARRRRPLSAIWPTRATRPGAGRRWTRPSRNWAACRVLVCNAGIAQVKLFTDTTDEDWRRMMAVDLDGAFLRLPRGAARHDPPKYGRILLVSSMWGQTGGSCEVAYSAAKAGLIGLGKALAKEEGPSGITVNVIAPGVIDTDMMAGFTAEDRAALAEEPCGAPW